MAGDLEYTEIELPIGGQDEGSDKRILAPGKFVSVLNGDYVKPGTLRKRPGIVRRANASTNDFPKGTRILRRGDQLTLVDATDTYSVRNYNQDQENYPSLPNGGMPPIPTATVRQKEIENDLTTDTACDVAGTTNGYIVYGMISCDLTSTQQCHIRVVEAASGSVVMSERVAPTRIVKYVRAAANGTTVLVTFSGADATDAAIEAVAVDCSFGSDDEIVLIGGSTNPTTTTDLTTDLDFGLNWVGHDLVAVNAANTWVAVYRQNATNAVRLMKVSLSGSVFTPSFQNIVSGTTPTMISIATANTRNDLVTNWFDLDAAGTGFLKYAVNNDVTLGAVLAPTNWESLTTTRPLATTIGHYQNGLTDDFVLFASHVEEYTPPLSKFTPITRTCSATRTGTVSSIQIKRRICVTSKPWQVGASQHAWCIVSDDDGNVIYQDSSDRHIYSHVLLSFQNNPAVTYFGIATNFWRPSLETSGMPDIAAPPTPKTQVFATLLQHLPQSFALIDGVYYTVQHRTYVVLEPRIGPIEYQVRYDHLGRYSNVEFGGDTYATGGAVTQWDGTRLYEVGAIEAPELTARVDLTGGSWGANVGQYQYIAVYEFVDSMSQRHYSLISPPKTVDVANATDKVLLEMEPLTITRFQRNAVTTEFQRMFISIYRTTLTAGGGATTFQRLRRYDQMPIDLVNNPGRAVTHTFTDTGFDNSLNEPLYAQTELENDPVYGGATAICVHKDRLWLGGGIDPEVLWFSKPRVDNRPAEFSIGQTFRVPGEEVVALGSLDEALIVFCSKGIYAVFGDGPDATGAGRPFDVPITVSADAVCNGPRSVLQIPQGLIFQTRNGLYLLDRKRLISYIGEPIKDTIAAYPIVMGVANEGRRGEAMFALSNADGTDGRVVVYNYLQGMWSVWEHKKRNADDNLDTTAWADITPWLNREVAYLASNGNLYEQQAEAGVYSDDTFFYPLDVETGWVSFGRLQGYKRIRKAGILMERFDMHGLEISMKFSYNETVAATIIWDQNQIANMGAVEWLRITVPRQKVPAIRLRVKEREATIVTEIGQYADTQGFAIDSFAFQIGMIPGLQRLPASQSG